MRKCNICSVELILDDNWYASSKKSSIYRCKKCFNNKTKKYYSENKEHLFKKMYEWKENNKEKHKAIVKRYNRKTIDKRKKLNNELYKSLGSGVYGFKYNDKWIYVGESVSLYRRWKTHLSAEKSKDRSPISKLIRTNVIDKSKLVFEVLESIDDKQKRFKRETYWIHKLNPSLNRSKVDIAKRL